MKNAENAASYDNQIKEMKEMQFARKFTPKEIEQWKGQTITLPIMLFFAQRRKVHI